MTNYPFAIAATQGPIRVMRLELLPFSLGQKVLLEREQSAFLRYDSKPTYEELIKAVLICARPYRENCTNRDGIFFRFKVRAWLRRCMLLDWDAEIEKLREHIAIGSLCPRIKTEGGRAPGSAWTLRLYQFLTMTLKVPLDAAWEYPYGLAQFEWCAHWESEGSLKVWNDDDETFERFCNEMDAKAAAELKGGVK